MTIEAAQTINELNTSYPRSNDLIKEGDDHIRMIKATLQRTFPRINGVANITSDTLNNLATFLVTSPNSMTVNATLGVQGNIQVGTKQAGNTGTIRWFGDTDKEVNFSILSGSQTFQINNANVKQFNFGGLTLANTNGINNPGQLDNGGAIVARNNSDPSNPSRGDYLNTPEIRSGFRQRGAFTNSSVPYGYFSMYYQEHVGSDSSGILQLVGFDNNHAWHFHQNGEFETENIRITGSSTGNIDINWGGRAATYQENGDIVERLGGNSIFRGVGGATNLSGALGWLRDRSNDAWNKANDAQVNRLNDIWMGGQQSQHYGQQEINWAIPSGGALTGIHQSPYYKNDTWTEDVYWRNIWKATGGRNQVIGMQ